MGRRKSERSIKMRRRDFLQASAVGGACLWQSAGSVFGAATSYAGLASDRFLGPVEELAVINDTKVFTEGPAALPDGDCFFTNVPASKILLWSGQKRTVSVFARDTQQTNGMFFDSRGRLLCCEGGAGRVTRRDLKTGKIEVLADKYGKFPFAAPNDLCADRSGRIYFTSRPGTPDPEKGNPNAVYRIDPDGKVVQLLRWPDIHMPNGIVLSPDEKTLYLIEAHPDANHHRDIRAYDLRADGTLANERVLINFYPGRSGDGMAIDAAGNLYVAAGLHKERGTSETLDTKPGIHVISPQGKLLGFRETPLDTVTNCAFGGKDNKTLFVTCGRKLLGIPTQIPGYRQASSGA